MIFDETFFTFRTLQMKEIVPRPVGRARDDERARNFRTESSGARPGKNLNFLDSFLAAEYKARVLEV